MSSVREFLLIGASLAVQRIIQVAGDSPYIEITVSPVASKKTIRELDISWDSRGLWRPDDWIALYNVPSNKITDPYLFSTSVKENRGRVSTGIQEGRKLPEVPDFSKKCLGFWAVYWRGKSHKNPRPVVSTCLTTNPTWMHDNWEKIKHIKLKHFFWPGSHNAGSYQLAYRPFPPDRLSKYIYCQDESIQEQLIHGARYLDFRIGKYPSGFWINHDIARLHILKYVLDEVKHFLNNTREIVVIDIHAFPVGFKNHAVVHTELVNFLKSQLGNNLVSYLGYDSTLQQIKNTGKRLIVAYNDHKISSRYPQYLWPPISQKWGNVQAVATLQAYLSKTIKQNPRGMWAAMAELTPTKWDVLFDRFKGLRNMAEMTNHDVTEWFRNEWRTKANIVAVDFIRSSGIVSAAIKSNTEKLHQSRNSRSVKLSDRVRDNAMVIF